MLLPDRNKPVSMYTAVFGDVLLHCLRTHQLHCSVIGMNSSLARLIFNAELAHQPTADFSIPVVSSRL